MATVARKKINLAESKTDTTIAYRARIIEQAFDRKIAQGREDMKMGRFTVVNKETNALFVEEMKKELCL